MDRLKIGTFSGIIVKKAGGSEKEMERVAENIAANIKKRRKELGYTQSALAALLGYSEKTVSKWECADGVPPTVVLPSLAKCLETNIDALLYESDGRQCYLGIDGGGTKTEFVLADSKGNIIKSVVLGSTNPNDVGLIEAKETLQKGVFRCCGDRALGTVSAFAGIAGSSSRENHSELSDFLAKMGFAKVRLGSDAENAISAGLGKRDGIAVIMGTGAVAYAKMGEKLFRVGGYGYLLGDKGSGFAVGRDVLLAALSYEDGSGEATSLHALAMEQCGSRSVFENLDTFYRKGKREVAKYAPLAFEAYRRGDKVAEKILADNISAVAGLILGAAKHFDKEKIRVSLCGGLTRDADVILPLLLSSLGERADIFDIGICDKPMVRGALLLAGLKEA